MTLFVWNQFNNNWNKYRNLQIKLVLNNEKDFGEANSFEEVNTHLEYITIIPKNDPHQSQILQFANDTTISNVWPAPQSFTNYWPYHHHHSSPQRTQVLPPNDHTRRS